MIAKNKVHKKILSYLKNKEFKKIYNNFDKFLNERNINTFVVSLSGGSDSMALAYFSKCHQILNNSKIYYVHIDHKLRKYSSDEARELKYFMKKFGINCEILNWKKNKNVRGTQENARIARYNLLENFCKRKKITSLFLAHHSDDLYENFFIRMLRGSGIRGLTSFSSTDTVISCNLISHRPFLSLSKNSLLNVTKKVFRYFITDPSNSNNEFLRIRIRSLLSNLQKDGFDKKKFNLTYCNLQSANETLRFYSNQNILKNTSFFKKNNKNSVVINSNFFMQPNEIVLRSFSSLISKINKKYYFSRGKTLIKKIKEIRLNSFKKATVGGCIVERVNNTIIIYPENIK